MAKVGVKLLVGASISGAVGLVFLIVSFATDYWVTADVTISKFENQVNYGLFTGRQDRNSLEDIDTYNLAIVCSFTEGVCMWSCQNDADLRSLELEILYTLHTASFTCIAVSAEYAPINASPRRLASTPDFLSPGLWVATIVFLSFAVLFNCLAFAFNIYNVFRNPIEFYSGVKSLRIYYGAAGCATILTLILWGAQYGAYIANNLAIIDTLTLDDVVTNSTLNFSYFFLIIALFEQCTAIGLITYREYRIRKAEEETVVRVDDATNNASTFMY